MRFAFLLSIPAVVGAAVFQLPDIASAASDGLLVYAVGFVTAAVSGYLAIRLVRLLMRKTALIPAGEEYIPSAIRELKEELNVTVQESDLIYCGQVHKDVDSEFHRQPFHDHQISNVYLLWLDREAEEFELQTEEIESVRWMDYAQVRGMVASDTLPNCIIMEELDLIERHFL